MISTKDTQVTIKLVLSVEEALWLHELTRNPMQEHETEAEATMRRAFYKATDV